MISTSAVLVFASQVLDETVNQVRLSYVAEIIFFNGLNGQGIRNYCETEAYIQDTNYKTCWFILSLTGSEFWFVCFFKIL